MLKTQTTSAGDEQITFTLLPLCADLAAAFPKRLLVAQSETRTVWASQPGRNVLLIIDEREPGGVRCLLLAIAFRADSASLAVYAKIVRRLVAVVEDVKDGWEEVPYFGRRRYKRYPFPPICPKPPRKREPVYDILPVPPFVPVPDDKKQFAKNARRKRGQTISGADSNYHGS